MCGRCLGISLQTRGGRAGGRTDVHGAGRVGLAFCQNFQKQKKSLKIKGHKNTRSPGFAIFFQIQNFQNLLLLQQQQQQLAFRPAYF